MTLLFPLSYHVEKPIMVMLSMSGNLCLSALSPVLFILSLFFISHSCGSGFIGPDTLWTTHWTMHTEANWHRPIVSNQHKDNNRVTQLLHKKSLSGKSNIKLVNLVKKYDTISPIGFVTILFWTKPFQVYLKCVAAGSQRATKLHR